jgi:hypothetical protein
VSGFEVAGIVLSAVGVLSPVFDVTSRLGTRARLFQENKNDVGDLLAGLPSLRRQLRGVRNKLDSQRCEIPQTNTRNFVQHLIDAEQIFAKADSELQDCRSLSRAPRAIETARTAATISSLTKRLLSVRGALMTVDGVAALAEKAKANHNAAVANSARNRDHFIQNASKNHARRSYGCSQELRASYVGLPLALTVAGRAVADSVTRTVGETAAGALLEFENDLRESANVRLLDDELRDGRSKYLNLASVFKVSLKAARALNDAKPTGRCHSMEEMLMALCVMPKKGLALLSMLHKLWDVETERDAAVVTRHLWSRSLMVEAVRDGVRGITLHDLVLEYCVKQAEESGCTASWHRRQLDGYVVGLLTADTGDKMCIIEDVIGYCQGSLVVLTREAAPHDWATTQRRVGDVLMKRVAGKRSLNIEEPIGCYRSALAVWTKGEAGQAWAQTQTALSDALRDRVAGERWRNSDECI